MTKNKINHPFIAPDGFFEEFKIEMSEKLNVQEEKHNRRFRTILLIGFKYAAIIALSFFLGRESMRLFNHEPSSSGPSEYFSVDAVYSQVSDDDITDYIIQNTPVEELEQLNVKQ
jgi:hypothetical protein